MSRSQSKNKDKESKKAVALQYDIEKDNAPRIIASGNGDIAKKIIETAKKHKIPIKKDQDVVEVLARFSIGDEVPPELYEVIAEILSFIYSLQNSAY